MLWLEKPGVLSDKWLVDQAKRLVNAAKVGIEEFKRVYEEASLMTEHTEAWADEWQAYCEAEDARWEAQRKADIAEEIQRLDDEHEKAMKSGAYLEP